MVSTLIHAAILSSCCDCLCTTNLCYHCSRIVLLCMRIYAILFVVGFRNNCMWLYTVLEGTLVCVCVHPHRVVIRDLERRLGLTSEQQTHRVALHGIPTLVLTTLAGDVQYQNYNWLSSNVYPGVFFLIPATNVDGMKDLWCSSTVWLLSTQLWMEGPVVL